MFNKNTLSAISFLFSTVFFTSLQGQAWYRDSTFGTAAGITWIDDPGTNDFLLTYRILPGGQILTLHRADAVYETPLSMLTPDGTFNPAFGDKGVLISPGISWTVLNVQTDSKILAAGVVQSWSVNSSSLWRYLPNGTPDSTFGGDSQVDSLLGDFDYQRIEQVIELADGKILVGGIGQNNSNEQHLQLTRLNSDGSRDLSFGVNGFAGFSFPYEQYRFNVLQIQPDGKILLGGNWQTVGHRNLTVFRFLADGMPDTGFGTLGKTNTDFNFGDDYVNTLLVYPDGKILAAGGFLNKSTGSFVPGMVRYLPDGKPDPDFGQSGKISLPGTGVSGTFNAIRLLPDGYLLCVLPKFNMGNSYKAFMVKRFRPDGQADNTPNSETALDDDWGVSVNPFGHFTWIADNRLIHVSNRLGNAQPGHQLALARYIFEGDLTSVQGSTSTREPTPRFFPNPASGAATLYVSAAAPGKIVLDIFSAQGHALLHQVFDVTAQRQAVLPETANWPPGVYFWQLRPEHGQVNSGYWIKTSP